MAKRLVISPITRINGFWRIDVFVDGGRIVDAYSSGAFFRGIEIILQGRDPRDAPYFTERICGICSSAHALASSLALERAASVEVPPNGVLIRNLILGADMIQNHVRHFYLFVLPDFAKGPDMPPFAPRYNVNYRLSMGPGDELFDHYRESLNISRKAHDMVTVFGGKVPHTHGIIAGGATVTPNADNVRAFGSMLDEMRRFIDGKLIPDTNLLSDVYSDYYELGKATGDMISYGMFPRPGGGFFMRGGAVLNGKVEELSTREIEEHIRFSRYGEQEGPRHPSEEKTLPDPEKEEAYSWVKAPRYKGKVVETGPLASMWVNGLYSHGVSAMDRIVARTLHLKHTVELMREWILALEPGAPVFTDFEIPQNIQASGLCSVMRGALGHWLSIRGGRIDSYQIVTPSAWNCSPRDDQGQRGAVEEALIGTPIEDEENPVEVGRIVRSFDPCLACGAHVILADGKVKEIEL